jgi:hypothetical protein
MSYWKPKVDERVSTEVEPGRDVGKRFGTVVADLDTTPGKVWTARVRFDDGTEEDVRFDFLNLEHLHAHCHAPHLDDDELDKVEKRLAKSHRGCVAHAGCSEERKLRAERKRRIQNRGL